MDLVGQLLRSEKVRIMCVCVRPCGSRSGHDREYDHLVVFAVAILGDLQPILVFGLSHLHVLFMVGGQTTVLTLGTPVPWSVSAMKWIPLTDHPSR